MKVVLIFCCAIYVILALSSPLGELDVSSDSANIFNKLIKEEVLVYLKKIFEGKLDDILRSKLRDDIISADIDEFVDKVVVSVRDYVEETGHDSIILPDESGIKLKPTGKLNLLEGSMSGLTSMQRYGHATLSYDRPIKKVGFEMILRLTEIDFIYKYHSKILFVSSTGHLHGKIEKFKVRVSLGWDFATYQAFVDRVDVKETGTINLWLSGNKGIDWLSNSVIKVVTSILHPVILNIVTKELKEPISAMVEAFNSAINQALHPSV